MTLDFTKLLELANQAKEAGDQVVEGKYGKPNITARKHLQALQNEAQSLKATITKMVSKKK